MNNQKRPDQPVGTPIADSIKKNIIGFEKWVLDNYNKYHKKNEKLEKSN